MTVASLCPVLTNLTSARPLVLLFTWLRRVSVSAILLGIFAATGWSAESPLLLPPVRVSLDTLSEFRPATNNWIVAGGVTDVSRTAKTLAAVEGTGVLINLPRSDAGDPLVTKWDHGDISLDLEFLVPAGSNSGVYFQGRYEIQIFDSWGVKQPSPGDNGGIYSRWSSERGKGNEAFEGHAPLANASRAPGLWQRLQVDFQAPRFNAQGAKISNAKFRKVMLNGFTVHENAEVSGPTRAALFDDEQAQGPLMIQGDHGPVAIRHIAVKRFTGQSVKVRDLALKFFAGEFDAISEYDAKVAKREASLEMFSDAVTEADGRGAARYSGTLIVPVSGRYAFGVLRTSAARLVIDGHVVISPNEGGEHVGQVALTAGEHRFQLDHIRGSRRATGKFEFWVEGPGAAPQRLGAPEQPGVVRTETARAPVIIEPADRILVQRAFVPFEPRKRLYAVSVGTPVGVHYAYDLDGASLLRVWRGKFLDASELWIERAEPQLARPTGPALTLGGQPLLTIFGSGDTRWPDVPPSNAASRGYRIEPDGQPVFLYEYIGVAVEDRIAALPDGRGITRTLRFKGKPWDRSVWVLIADSATITPEPYGTFVIGDREYYIDWVEGSSSEARIRKQNGRQQLVVHLPTDNEEREFTYKLIW